MVKILLLAANPVDTRPVDLGLEIRGIEERLERARYRDYFVFEPRHRVRRRELIDRIQGFEPTIVHFSGHGSRDGAVLLEGESGESAPAAAEVLGDIFRVLAPKIGLRCVVLNACYSATQASAIAEHVDFVVGMGRAVSDETSIELASQFYSCLANGSSVREAFELSRTAVKLAEIPESDVPRLLVRAGADDTRPFIVGLVPPSALRETTSLEPQARDASADQKARSRPLTLAAGLLVTIAGAAAAYWATRPVQLTAIMSKEAEESIERKRGDVQVTALPYETLHARAVAGDADVLMIDDPWVPELVANDVLMPIDFIDDGETRVDLRSGDGSRLPNTFVPSTRRAAEWKGHVYALPVVGNVELFLVGDSAPKAVRDAVLAPQTDGSILDGILEAYEGLGAARDAPGRFGLRGETPNDVIDMYWQLLRVYGNEERTDADDAVVIDSCASARAISWLRAMVPYAGSGSEKDGFADIQHSLTEKAAVGATLAWPFWIAGKAGKVPDLRVKRAARVPLMGLWLLGVSKRSRHPKEALRFISRFVTKDLQDEFVRRGSLPVVTLDDASSIKAPSAFWTNNYEPIEEALRDSVPRPRTPKWWNIEQDLGKRIEAYVFEGGELDLSSEPELYRFTGSCPLKQPAARAR